MDFFFGKRCKRSFLTSVLAAWCVCVCVCVACWCRIAHIKERHLRAAADIHS